MRFRFPFAPGGGGPSWKSILRLFVGVVSLAALIALALVLFRRVGPVHPNAYEARETTLEKEEDLHAPGDKPMTLQLKGIATDNGQFVTTPAVIYQSKSRVNQMKQAVLAYLSAPREGRVRVAGPPGILLNVLYMCPDGTVVVDLTVPGPNPSFGFWEETVFVRGLLFVLNNHFPEAKRVRLLMDGQESGTLAGHYSLGSPAGSYAKPGSDALPE